MKKVISVILALVMTLSIATVVAADEAPGGFVVGFLYSAPTDAATRAYYDGLTYIANAFGCSVVFAELTGYATEDYIAGYESLIQQGAQGLIMYVDPSASFLTSLNEKGVYYTGLSRMNTAENAKVTEGSEYFCGWLDESNGLNWQLMHDLTVVLSEAGCKNVAYIGLNPGSAISDQRYNGFSETAAALGMTEVTSIRSYDHATAISDLLASYGEQIDGIVAHSMGEAIPAGIIVAGKQDTIKYVMSDLSVESDHELFELGLLKAAGAGQAAMPILNFMLLYNKMAGADALFADNLNAVPNLMSLVVTNNDDLDLFIKYFMGDVAPFTADEMKQCCSLYSGKTVAEMEEYWRLLVSPDRYNVKSVSERHADLFK